MAWHVFEKLLEGVANYSTLIGKLWITFFFIFRIIIVASIGDSVYSDERSQFICNTLTPGCTNVCYNRFSPISQIRFWAVQILIVGTPSVIFVVFALHKMSNLTARNEEGGGEVADRRPDEYENRNLKRRRRKKWNYADKHRIAQSRSRSNNSSLPQYEDLPHGRPTAAGAFIHKVKNPKNNFTNQQRRASFRPQAEVVNMEPEKKQVKMKTVYKTVYNKDGKFEVMKTRSISVAYFIQTFITIAIEATFCYFQYDMYKFEVNELYVCTAEPCPRTVDCYVSRPREKTIFLHFMYVVSSLSIVINLLELAHLTRKYMGKGRSIKQNSYLHEYPSGTGDDRRYRARMSAALAYPSLGPYPRKHGNSMTDTDNDGSIGSDYSYYRP